jgi:hypothetical protein
MGKAKFPNRFCFIFPQKMNKGATKKTVHHPAQNGGPHLEVPLLVVTQSPDPIIGNEFVRHDAIDVGFLGDELLSDDEVEEEFERVANELKQNPEVNV